ncbi:MAG: diguanylate cyclase [Lachnospiraceae bacterium]|nr:diguanylate cyclase [Lachnospiraceae bacterium]
MQKKIRRSMISVLLVIMAISIAIMVALQLLDVKDEIVVAWRYSVLFLAVALIVIFFMVDRMINRQMIRGLKQLIKDMDNIAAGNLNVVSCVNGNEEFVALSHGINTMVRNISRTSGMLSRVFDMMDAQFAVFEYNDDSKRVMTTDRIGQLLSIPSDELGPMVHDKDLFRTRLAWIIKSPIKGETDIYQFGTPEKPRYVRINVVKDADSTFGMVADATEEIRQKQAIIRERDYDALTKIRNRRSFERDVTALLQRGRLSEGAMIMIDLDKFKGINDNYGHAFGDSYLKHAADFIKRFDERNCIVARRSGDEFYLLTYGHSSKDEIRKLAQRFYEMLKAEPIDFPDGTKKSIGMSMGIAWYVPGIRDFNAFLACADDALYEAKEGGRNTYGERMFSDKGKQ